MISLAWKSLLKWTIKNTLIIWVANVLIFTIITLLDQNVSVLSAFFTKAALFETGIAFLVGGIMAFSSSALPSKAREHISKSEQQWSIDNLKAGERKANKYLLLAVVLFVQSLIISILGY